MASAGDVNGDGYADVIIADISTGLVSLFLGNATTGLVSTPAATLTSTGGSSESFGRSLAGAGDINGDGYADVIVGAIGFEADLIGRAYLFLGAPDGLGSTPVTLNSPEMVTNAQFGTSVAGAGDTNGDGYQGVLVTGSGLLSHGYLYRAGAAGLATTPTAILTGAGGIDAIQ